MNRLIMIYGCVLLSSTAIAAIQGNPWELNPSNEMEQDISKFENQITAIDAHSIITGRFETPLDMGIEEPSTIHLNDIKFMEDETIELGFDTRDYLPNHFDPNSIYVDLANIAFIEMEEPGLGFDTKTYLPNGFDAHAVSTDLSSIHFIEDQEITLGFDTQDFLPEGFSPYVAYFDLNSIEYIEMDELDDIFLMQPETDCANEKPLN